MNSLDTYQHIDGLSSSARFTVMVNGRELFVHESPAACFCSFSFSGEVSIRIEGNPEFDQTIIRPLQRGVESRAVDSGLEFSLDLPGNFCLETPGELPLLIFANPPEEDIPDRDDPGVVFFAAGEIHEAGKLTLKPGQTLYLEEGAVVRGSILVSEADNVRICGRGVLDGTIYKRQETRFVLAQACEQLTVEGIILLGTPSWNLTLAACRHVTVDNIKCVSWIVCSDGVDVVGSKEVTVRNSFFFVNDDCVAIKSVHYRRRDQDTPVIDHRGDVSKVLVEKCVMYNQGSGNLMEIGFETQTERISDITFRDIDVIGAHVYAGVFTIHNGDRAVVEDILYENIRVEHYFSKLIDIRILDSRYSVDSERGHIRNIFFRDIDAAENRHNTISVIGGCDAEHLVTGVTFENFRIGGRKAENADDLQLFTTRCSDFTFR